MAKAAAAASAKTKRRAAAATAKSRAARLAAPPAASEVELCLATLVDAPPVGDDWLFETKYDGYRILARIADDKAQLSTRKALDFTARAPSVARALEKLAVKNALLDGELLSPPRTASSQRKAGDFQALQNALSEGRSEQLIYYAFDLLFLDGQDLRKLPLEQRKQLLSTLLSKHDDPHVKLSEHLSGRGETIFQKACELGFEGVIAKRKSGPYAGGRGKSWLKIKCLGRQEFVVVGYTPPSGSRAYLGALLVATRDGTALRYAGKVGTGFSQSSLRELHGKLSKLRRDTAPLSPVPRGAEVRDAIWVEPQLVAEVEFTEFTADGRLRHPSFQGLREDKSAGEVKRERPKRR